MCAATSRLKQAVATKPLSTCALLFDVLKDEDGGEQLGGALRAAVQFGH
jgi:hypothetical protein